MTSLLLCAAGAVFKLATLLLLLLLLLLPQPAAYAGVEDEE